MVSFGANVDFLYASVLMRLISLILNLLKYDKNNSKIR